MPATATLIDSATTLVNVRIHNSPTNEPRRVVLFDSATGDTSGDALAVIPVRGAHGYASISFNGLAVTGLTVSHDGNPGDMAVSVETRDAQTV